jgi:hypothetical protein
MPVSALSNIKSPRDVKSHVDGFNDLILWPGHEEMVSGLVRIYSVNEDAGIKDREVACDSELVWEGGKGLSVLFYGGVWCWQSVNR